MNWVVWLVIVLGLLAGLLAGLRAFGSQRWAGATRMLTRALDAASTDAKTRSALPARYDAHELIGLPAPVQRYFRTALREGQPLVATVVLDQTGTINMSPAGASWKSFTARQRNVLRRPGFLWDATIALLPGVAVRVHDAYVAGEGVLRASVLGVFDVANLRGGGDIACGELIRFFAETAWYPTALLPSQGVRWEAVDEHSANGTIVDGPLALTLLFRFNDRGLIDSVRAAARGATRGKETVLLPWEGRFANYQVRDGMTVPISGEAVWIRPDGPKVYWRGSVTSIAYEFVA